MSCVHVCLLSDQLLPNLIPALAERPARVYLVTSREMAGRNQHMRLSRLLRDRDIETVLCSGAPIANLPAIRAWAGALCARLREEEIGREIVLNATGGTKLLALGCVEVFRQELEGRALRIIYTDTAHQMIETIVPPRADPTPMQSVLDVSLYLAAQGMHYRLAASDDEGWRERAELRRSLTVYLAEHAEELASFIGALNRLVHGTNEHDGALSSDGTHLVASRQRFDEAPRGTWLKTLERIEAAGLLTAMDGPEIEFTDADAARYLGGHWLEEYAWLTARDCDLEDVRCGVEGVWESDAGSAGPSNEFDLLAVHGNRMLLVECKTLRLDSKDEKAQAQIAKLESLGRNAGGLFGTTLLLSARELSPPARKRCKMLRVPLREARDIRNLSGDLRAWKEGSPIPLQPHRTPRRTVRPR